MSGVGQDFYVPFFYLFEECILAYIEKAEVAKS